MAEGRAIGEVAPTYFVSPEARERIARLIPEARVVCTFRNPVDRVLSLYRLKRAYGLIPWNLEDALRNDPELMESRRYASYLKEWQKTFGNSQVLVTVHDDMPADPQSYLDRLLDFVGAPRPKLAPSQISACADLRRHDTTAQLLLDARRDSAGLGGHGRSDWIPWWPLPREWAR